MMQKNSAPDIFGLAFKDYLAGIKDGKISVHTKLTGFTELDELPVAYFFRDFHLMPEWEQLALAHCRGLVLDVGAGAGAHALELQNRGMDVYAIDISPGAVEIMQERGVKQAFCSDFMKVSGQKFNTILFLMNGIGMAKDLDGLKELLLHSAGLLVPGGVVLLESTDIIYMYKEEDGSILIPLGEKYYGEITYCLSYNEYEGEPFPWLFVDFDNLQGIAGECGFSAEILYRGENYNYVAAFQVL